jgi:hypothetical protein
VNDYRNLSVIMSKIRKKILENGARGLRVDEPLTWVNSYPIEWHGPSLDKAELARLRFIEGWSESRLAREFGCTRSKVRVSLRELSSRN